MNRPHGIIIGHSQATRRKMERAHAKRHDKRAA
jgi:hypothetical protein